MHGRLIIAYLLFAGIFFSVLGFVFYRQSILFSFIFYVDSIVEVGVLVDITAHLFLGKVSSKLSALNDAYLLREFLDGRTHVDYGVMVATGASILGLVYSHSVFLSLINAVILMLALVQFALFIKARYYH